MRPEISNVPEGWARTSLREVCDILDHRRIPVNHRERSRRIAGKRDEDLYPYYGATGKVGVIDDFIFDGEHILMGEDGAPFLDPIKNKAYLVHGRFWVNNHAHILRSMISNKYLCHYLNTVDYSPHVTGTTRHKLTQRSMKDILVSMPGIVEQYRIVSKIEELFSELDEGIESLEKARAQLAIYRQAVLKHAFEGSLTTKWRANNAHRGESAIVVLSLICQELKADYREQLRSWKFSFHQWERKGREARRPSKPRNSVRAGSLSPAEVGTLHKLPDRWTWCRIEEIGKVQLGRQRSPKHMSGPNMRPYLRVANVFESRIDTSDVFSMNFTPSEFTTYELKCGDILLNEGQSLELVGRPAMFDGEVSGCCFQNTLVRFRSASGLDARYALYLFIHYLKSGRFRRIAKWTNNIAHLGAKRFANLEFPLCPVPEQQEIARVLDETFEAVECTEREIDAGSERTRTLRQSILKQAFSGMLVPQDPNDPPVSILLDRIRAEREQIAKRTELRKTGKRKRGKVPA